MAILLCAAIVQSHVRGAFRIDDHGNRDSRWERFPMCNIYQRLFETYDFGNLEGTTFRGLPSSPAHEKHFGETEGPSVIDAVFWKDLVTFRYPRFSLLQRA